MNIPFEQITTVLIQLAIWITLLMVLVTLLKIRAQNKSTCLSELFPSDLDVDMMVGGHNICSWTNQFSNDSVSLDSYQPFLVNIYNIGSGPAKNIQYGWNFDFEPLIEKISAIDYSNIYDRVHITNNHSYFSLAVVSKEKHDFTRGCITPNGIFHQVSFLLPSNDPGNKLSIEIPYAYCLLTGLLLHDEYCRRADPVYDEASKNEFTKQFDLHFQISYEDAVGNKYSKLYLGHFDLCDTDGNIDNQYSKIVGKLKFHEVKK
jgi:hypothetical protein